MSSRRHLAFAILSLLVVVGLGGVLLVWPAYREAARHNRRTSLLQSVTAAIFVEQCRT